jgi:CheY-like chemotaxis protein
MKKIVTLIIVEDDDGHALLIKRNLKRNGIVSPVIFFQNGEEVLQFIRNIFHTNTKQSKHYIILLDIKMPKIDGIEVLKELKGDPLTVGIPIIMITTTNNPREIDLCHTLGCNSYLVKPIDYLKLIKIVENLGYSLDMVNTSNPNK